MGSANVRRLFSDAVSTEIARRGVQNAVKQAQSVNLLALALDSAGAIFR